MIDDKRKQWLRGAYLDRITETAQAYAAGHAYFVDAEWEAYIAGEFEYLTELSAEDHSCLRDQAGLEAFRRIVAALSSAREEAFGKLIIDNADIIHSDARFALDLGWIRLLQQAADRVRTYPESWRARIVGAKEKLACLVVHIACDYDQRGCRSEVERLREEVRLRSLSTCEICGSPGRLRLSGFAKTVCIDHVGVLGELRDDDGRWADPWRWHDDQVDIDVLTIMDPPMQRPTEHVTDPLRSTALGRRIDDDTWSREGREQELLVEFGGHLQDAVNGAAVKVEYLDGYVHDEVAGWREFAVQPLTPADEEFLQGYLRALIEEEYERIKNNR
ncbi:hypothetical protein GOC43_28915 [Sinorhizobium meliloti]|nr:hypothetical protein [Sinorhizobium meliloti]